MKIVDRMESIICLDCDNCESGDEPWGNFERDDTTKVYFCNECGSKNIGFISDIKHDADAEDWIRDGYYEQLSEVEKKVANKEQALKAIEDLLSDPDQVSYGNGVRMEGSLYPDVKIGLEIALKLLKDEKPDYNHKFDIAFSVTSQKEDPYKVLPTELRAALITRIAEIDVEKGWEEAVGFCDSYEVEKKND